MRTLLLEDKVEDIMLLCQKQINLPRTRNDISARFTLIEMLVVIAIIGILVSLLLPSLQVAMDTARLTNCSSNQKQIGIVLHQYAEDNHGRIPHSAKNWISSTKHYPYAWLINPYLAPDESNNTRIPVRFKCPLNNSETNYSYGLNTSYYNKNIFNLKMPGRAIMLADGNDCYLFPNRWTKNYRYRHFDDGNSGIGTQAGTLSAIHGDLHIKTYAWVDGEITSPHDRCKALVAK